MINLVIALDQRYIMPAMVMLDSLFKHNSKSKLHIFIIVQDKKNITYDHLKNLVLEYGGNCTILEIQTSILKNAKVSHHISLATYYRLLLADTLPTHIDKILFLDCDILIQGPIEHLYKLNIEDYDIAAVEEAFDDTHKTSIGMDLDKNYFNAGVMLVNLKNWRTKKYTYKFINYLEVNHNKIVYWDQDVLNASIENRLIVEKKWNLREGCHKRFLDEKIEANILHFTGKCKPWNCRKNKLSKFYFNCILQSSSKTLYSVVANRFRYELKQSIKNLGIRSLLRQIILLMAYRFKYVRLFLRTYNYKQF